MSKLETLDSPQNAKSTKPESNAFTESIEALSSKPKSSVPAPTLDANRESKTLPNGDVQGKWPDGGAFLDHTNSVGARVRTNPEAQVERVTRPDGSVANCAYEDGKPIRMAETRDGQTTYWKPSDLKEKDGKAVVWVSEQAPGQERRNMALESNGNLTFNINGEKHIVRSSGAELVEGKGKSTYDFDPAGRITRINYPDAITSFGFDYKGKSKEVEAVTTFNRQTNAKIVEKPDHTWGEPKVANDGTYSQVAYQWDPHMGKQMFKGEQKFHTDGKFVINSLHYGGSVEISDRSGIVGRRGATPNDFVDIAAARAARLKPVELPDLEISQGPAPMVPGKPQSDAGGGIKVEKTPSKPEVAEQVKPADKISETAKAPLSDLDRARENLRTEAKSHGIDVARLDVFASAFEERAKEAKRLGLEAPSNEQMAKTYNTFAETLRGPAQPGGLSDEKRADLVKLSMYNVAYPRRIDQGLNLCNVTTSEVYTASRNPENYARLIKEVSLTGDYTTTTGQKIHLPAGSIDRDPEQSKFTTENVGANRWRNWASKVFQETGINSVVPFLPASENAPAWGKPHVSGKSDMSMEQIQSACKAINGKPMPYFGISDAPTAQELLALKEKGDFPAGIHTIHVTDRDGVVSGLHVQTIHDARVRNGELEVLLDNQKGTAQDAGWVSLPKLYEVQQLHPPKEWTAIPEKYRGDFDSLKPVMAKAPEASSVRQPSVPAQVLPRISEASEKEKPAEKPLEKPLPAAADSVTEARNALERAVDAGFKGHHGEAKSVRKAHEIMDSFERRCVADRKSGLVAPTDAQIAKAYRSAYETLTNPGVMPASDRQKLVLEGLRNISDPTGIDQGNHGSCGNTCGEKFIAVRNPDVYMNALEQVARDATCKTKDGRVLKLPHDDPRQGYLGQTLMSWQRGWKPDSESRAWDVEKETGWHPLRSNDGKRNYASQIIQNLNLADALESNRLGQRQVPAPVDALNFLNVEDFTKRMTGKPITTINQQLETEGNIRQPLTDALALRLKEEGRLPAMVWRAFHWQTIHDVRTVSGRGLDPNGRPFGVVEVLSDNQWGNSKDRGWETVPELHRELAESP